MGAMFGLSCLIRMIEEIQKKWGKKKRQEKVIDTPPNFDQEVIYYTQDEIRLLKREASRAQRCRVSPTRSET